MSCFNCYSTRKIESEFIDRILERGHKLRSAVVQSILDNDPLNQDVIIQEQAANNLSNENFNKLQAYLQGYEMSREDEISALETLRNMSATDLCKVTDRTYQSNEACDCLTCNEYNEKDLKCDIKRQDNVITQKIKERYKIEYNTFIKFIDSIKISINNVTLNEAGNKKVFNSLVKDKALGVGQTFFLEYQIPEILAKNHQKNKAKVDSGLDHGSIVRLCSRRTNSQAINFKQTSVHSITNLNKLNNAVITFHLSFRNFKQKQPISLGVAKFEFKSFEVSKNLTCNQELTFRLSNENPIVVGCLKVSIMLGCGQLYFGKEFVDAITNNKENSVVLDSNDFSPCESDIEKTFDTKFISESEIQTILDTRKNNPQRIKSKPQVVKSDNIPKETPVKLNKKSLGNVKKTEINSLNCESSQKSILFGFVYISEARFSREVQNLYFMCQLFATDDICRSEIIATFGYNPSFNFSQHLPLVCDDRLLLNFRENFMVVEFFERGEKDFLIGLTKLSLHQFYLAYRNPVIIKYLSNEKFPVIGTDGWTDICNPYNGEVVGQVQLLIALGTKQQIQNLENDRGFKNNLIKAKVKINVGVQSDMDQKNFSQKEVQVGSSNNTEPQLRSTSDLLDTLQKALTLDNVKEKNWFKAQVAINNALHLPIRRKCKSKKSKGRKHEEILPSTYVTFEDYRNDLKITSIVAKNTSPKWDFKCEVGLPVDYLTDNQKPLVFKIWRKSTNTTMSPNMQVDHVIGFATVDLTVLLAGMPNVQGWYNINDLSKKCNGQINIHITPLENITKYQLKKCDDSNTDLTFLEPNFEPGELLGRALKRKFTELDEITQRLRLRLSKVTDESDTSNDEIADEFERDINTLCVEDDFDMVNFENEARTFNENHLKEIGLLQTDQILNENKQKIDHLLEKLSLVSGDTSSRYVSGCSDTGRIDTEAILNELDSKSRPNLHSLATFQREMEEKFGVKSESEDGNKSDDLNI